TAFVTGSTESSGFPTTPGAYDTTFKGYYDVFVAKLSADGSRLLYSTFLGGNGPYDYGEAIEVKATDEALVTGLTFSSDFPTTPGSYDTTFNGGHDAFIAKLSADGGNLLFSTFLGGSADDFATGIARDVTGAVLVTGTTLSADFPTTPQAYDTSFHGSSDVFVSKLSADGSRLLYSTFLGGNDHDVANGIALDDTGAALVTGDTSSSDFPATSRAYDTTFNGSTDAFV